MGTIVWIVMFLIAAFIASRVTRAVVHQDMHNLPSDSQMRLLLTFAVVFLVLVGSFFLLIFPSQIPGSNVDTFVTGILGLTLGWVFVKESTTSAASQTEKSISLGAAVQKNGHGTAPITKDTEQRV